MNPVQYLECLHKIEKLKCNTRHSWTSCGTQESVAEHSWRLSVMALLAADESGRTLLSQLRKGCNFNVVTKPADAPVGVQSNISRVADEVYARAMPNRYSSDYFVKCKPYMAVK